MEEAHYVELALSNPALVWNGEALSQLAATQVPDAVLGRRRGLLRADAGQQWAQWFVEGFADPRRYVGESPNYALVFGDVAKLVNFRFSEHTRDERRRIASAVSRSVHGAAVSLSEERRRASVDPARRMALLEDAGDPPRCRVCGTSFGDVAVEAFLRSEPRLPAPPPFVDILKPKGLRPQDGRIEVDHLVPFAMGGGEDENFVLTCGWCNRHKSARVSIYDVEGRPRTARRNAFGVSSLPQPFWAVRQLVLSPRCEHPAGCAHTTANTALTVAPANPWGALNPGNLMTTCLEHDPLRTVRLQPPTTVKDLWP